MGRQMKPSRRKDTMDSYYWRKRLRDEQEREMRTDEEDRRAKYALDVAATDGYGPEGDIIPEDGR